MAKFNVYVSALAGLAGGYTDKGPLYVGPPKVGSPNPAVRPAVATAPPFADWIPASPPTTPVSPSTLPQRSGYWWTGRYSTSASQPGAYEESGGRVFPTLRNSDLKGEALRGAQESFTRIKLLEGNPVEVIRGQAGEAGLTVHGNNARLADQGAENAIQKAINWNNNRQGAGADR